MYGIKTCECNHSYHSVTEKCPSCGASEQFGTIIYFNENDWVYDLETYPNIFTCVLHNPYTDAKVLFEISDRKNEINELLIFLRALSDNKCRMIGFNNVAFDYPILHFIMTEITTLDTIYSKSQQIVSSGWGDKFSFLVWESDTLVKQIDLMKIHHFDNTSRMTSLKLLEFNMCMENIQDLPFPPGTLLTDLQKDTLIKYNWHDVEATTLFYIQSLEMIKFREELSDKYSKNFLNHSDKKIGSEIFTNLIESNAPGTCYDLSTRPKTKRQTIRESIRLADVILPYINFEQPEFNRILNYLKSQTITNYDKEYLNIKGVFKNLVAIINDFQYKFGSGGIHASVSSQVLHTDQNYIIKDWDVGGYYPELGTANSLYPEHLGLLFCEANKQLAEQRKQYPKGTALNNSIKLSRNGAYGDSNNKYSPFYDPQYTMSITINGQLLLCMLAEQLIKIPGLRMIQCNTDGLTVHCPKIHEQTMNNVCKWWDEFTQLKLESATYKRMFIRDVNNYIAEYEDGKIKSKGTYVYKTKQSQGNIWTPDDMDWNQDCSSLIIAKAVNAVLITGVNLRDYISQHKNIYDFMLRTKVGKSADLVLILPDQTEIKQQKITRFFITSNPCAGQLVKLSLPASGKVLGGWRRANSLTDEYYNSVIKELYHNRHLHRLESGLDASGFPWDARINTKNKSKYKIRRDRICAGHNVVTCNNISDADFKDIDYQYYINEAQKLINPFL